MADLEKNLSGFDAANTQVLGISVDSPFANKEFGAKYGVKSYPLLGDMNKEVAKSYGILRNEGFSERAAFLIDKQGVVRWREVQSDFRNQPNIATWLEAAKKL